MTANAQTRYDFGRVTVEHVGPHDYSASAWGANPRSLFEISRRGVVVRVQQSHMINAPDEAIFTLLDCDARDLAKQLLEALEAE